MFSVEKAPGGRKLRVTLMPALVIEANGRGEEIVYTVTRVLFFFLLGTNCFKKGARVKGDGGFVSKQR